MVNKMIKKSYIVLNILSIILLNNNIISMQKQSQDNIENQDSTNIVGLLPAEILLTIIEKNIINHIDNWDDIFKLDNVIEDINKEISNASLICRAFNDIKTNLLSIRNRLVDEKFKILKDKMCDKYGTLSKKEVTDLLEEFGEIFEDEKIDFIEDLCEDKIYNIIRILMFNTHPDIEYYLISDAIIAVTVWAAAYDNRSIIRVLLKSGYKLLEYTQDDMPENSNLMKHYYGYDNDNGRVYTRYSPILVALYDENEAMADFLISKGSDIDSAFVSAVASGNIDIIKYFIRKKPGLISGARSNDALLFAIMYVHKKTIKFLLDLGVDINANGGAAFLSGAYSYFTSGDMINFLLDNGANINANDVEKDSYSLLCRKYDNALHVAIKECSCFDEEKISVLIDRGININARNIDGDSALILLIKHRADPWGYRFYGEEVNKTFKLLIDKKADVNTKDNSGKSALMWATDTGDIELATMLIRSGADVNAKDENGDTALIYALKFDRYEIFNLLMVNGANIANDLLTAAKNGYPDIVSAIINSGVGINISNTFGETALILAVKSNNIDVVKLLINKHCDVNIKNVYGRDALILAVESGNIDIVRLLVDNGADINYKDEFGNNVLSSAMQTGNEDMINLLMSKKSSS